MSERRRELLVGDLFVIDLEVFEEGLVEEAAFCGVSLEIGGLDVVGELERVFDRFEDVLVVDLEAFEELVGGDAFASNSFLLFGEDVVADPVLVMGGQQFSFFVVEADDLGAGSVGLFVGEGGEPFEVGVDGVADSIPLLVAELDRCVMAFDRLLDRFDAVVGLGAEAGATAAANEVLVGSAAAPRTDEEEPAAAVGADQAAA